MYFRSIVRYQKAKSILQKFFISIGARYKRIRKHPRRVPSPQLYEYMVEKFQELESPAAEGRITLYYADESHTCTEGYVPYGWQLRGEDVFVPSQGFARLNDHPKRPVRGIHNCRVDDGRQDCQFSGRFFLPCQEENLCRS